MGNISWNHSGKDFEHHTRGGKQEMTKTIKEMGLNYALEKWNPGTTAFDECEESYLEGAKAVLDIIEKELPKSDNSLNDYGKALLWRINERIKELKEE